MTISPIFSITFVPTAGALKKVYWRDGRQAPFWLTWPTFKGYLKKLEKNGTVSVRFLNELKLETISRLDETTELYRDGRVNAFFLSGGKTGRRPKERDSMAMMKDWLINLWIDDKAVVLDRETLQTADKVEAFVKYLEKIDSDLIIIWVVTSWYHIPRTLYLLRKAIAGSPKLSKKCLIKHKAVFPPLTRKCLKYEYAYNMLAELFKLTTVDSEILRAWWKEREEKLREVEK